MNSNWLFGPDFFLALVTDVLERQRLGMEVFLNFWCANAVGATGLAFDQILQVPLSTSGSAEAVGESGDTKTLVPVICLRVTAVTSLEDLLVATSPYVFPENVFPVVRDHVSGLRYGDDDPFTHDIKGYVFPVSLPDGANSITYLSMPLAGKDAFKWREQQGENLPRRFHTNDRVFVWNKPQSF